MVGDKVHSRSRGPSTFLTHWPLEGRRATAGYGSARWSATYRFAHGVPYALNERMSERDGETFAVCALRPPRDPGAVAASWPPSTRGPQEGVRFARHRHRQDAVRDEALSQESKVRPSPRVSDARCPKRGDDDVARK